MTPAKCILVSERKVVLWTLKAVRNIMVNRNKQTLILVTGSRTKHVPLILALVTVPARSTALPSGSACRAILVIVKAARLTRTR